MTLPNTDHRNRPELNASANDQGLCCHGLKVRRQHKQILNDISLHIPCRGSITGLLGPNGAGKSTLFKCIMGFLNHDEGNIVLDAQNLNKRSPSQRSRMGLGYLPQESWLFQDFNVWNNLKIFVESDPKLARHPEDHIARALQKMSIEHLKDEKAKNLSGGEKRRLEFARTLLFQPKIILLDEPFTGIDPITINEISLIIKELKHQQLGILISDHQAEKILNLVDQVHILYQGKALASGSPEEIRRQDEVRDLYLGWE